jgi:hypothetical protein
MIGLRCTNFLTAAAFLERYTDLDSTRDDTMLASIAQTRRLHRGLRHSFPGSTTPSARSASTAVDGSQERRPTDSRHHSNHPSGQPPQRHLHYTPHPSKRTPLGTRQPSSNTAKACTAKFHFQQSPQVQIFSIHSRSYFRQAARLRIKLIQPMITTEIHGWIR